METTIKQKGVKKGTKRGPYKKTLKTDNEKIINKMDSLEIANETTQTTNETVVESIQNNTIVSNEVSTDNLSESIKRDASDSNNTNNDYKQYNERTEFKQTSGEEKLSSFFDEYQDTTEKPNETTQVSKSEPSFQHNQNMKMLINGYMLLSLCDVIFPYGIKFLFGLFNPKAKKVNVSEMKLEPEQREALMNSADAVAQYVFEKTNPMTVFVICLGLFYGTNFNNAMQNVKE